LRQSELQATFGDPFSSGADCSDESFNSLFECFKMSEIVCIDYESLTDGSTDLSQDIQNAFGAAGLGIILIRGIPGLSERRSSLLNLAHKLAGLSDIDKSDIEDAESRYSFGWSHGKERLEDGRMDTFKGSFYANPCLDDPANGNAELSTKHPAYLRPNLWPAKLPQLKQAFKDLGQSIVSVGLELIKHCEQFAARHGIAKGSFTDSISKSRNHKARLLYYFSTDSAAVPSSDAIDQHWCGWHLDHGSITGLISAMYFDKSGEEVPNPDPSAGLYIRNRNGDIIKASIPPDCLAFQMGEALQICSGDVLQATPHYVRSCSPSCSPTVSISRATFAVFLQPSYNQPLSSPAGMTSSVPGWTESQTFSDFSAARFSRYYKP
jgi:isopenicillin N synthase-like dioxygenase